jgi:tetratricopeptide (TPR) repeat protein
MRSLANRKLYGQPITEETTMQSFAHDKSGSRFPGVRLSARGAKAKNNSTLKRALALLFLMPQKWHSWIVSRACTFIVLYLIAHLAVDCYKQRLTVPPVSVPPSLETRGYRPDSMAGLVTIEMQRMGALANVTIPHEEISGASESRLDIRIPGQEVTYHAVLDFLKQMTHRADVAVRIDIAEKDASRLVAHLRVEGGPFDGREAKVDAGPDATDIDAFIKEVGTTAMRLAQPNVLASHLVKEAEDNHCSGAGCDLNFSKAEQIYDEVLRLPMGGSGAQAQAIAQAGKADILIIRGRFDDARELSKEGIDRFGESAALHQINAVALEHNGHRDEAIRELRASVKRPDATAETWRVYGDVLIHAWKESGDPKQYEEAIDAFQSADKTQPRFADNLHDWGEALLSNGKLDDAVKKFSLAVSVSGDRHGPSRIGWSIALYCKGDVKGARVELDRASRINGNDDDVARVLAAMSNGVRTRPGGIMPVGETALAGRGTDGSLHQAAHYRQCAQGMLRARSVGALKFRS